jgi:DNA mismatch endonuclease (patch repair protein)
VKRLKEYKRDGRAPIPEKESVSKVMSANKSKNTKPEIILRKGLWASGIKGYRLHWKKAPGSPDISFPGKRVAIFVNGCFWHRCPYCELPLPKTHSRFWHEKFKKNIQRDKKKIELLQKEGWKTLIIWECQLANELKAFISKIKLMLDEND